MTGLQSSVSHLSNEINTSDVLKRPSFQHHIYYACDSNVNTQEIYVFFLAMQFIKIRSIQIFIFYKQQTLTKQV